MANLNNPETQALNSALFKLQQNGWNVCEVYDGEETHKITLDQSNLRIRQKAIDLADDVDAAAIGIRCEANPNNTAELSIVWGNGADCIIADICSWTEVLEELEEIIAV